MTKVRYINENNFYYLKDKYDELKQSGNLPEDFSGNWKKDYIKFIDLHDNKEESCPADVKRRKEDGGRTLWQTD